MAKSAVHRPTATRRFVTRVVLLSTVTLLSVLALSAQVQAPSSLVRPALDSVARAGSAVDLNHWKGSAASRDEVDANLASMQKNLQTTLPPLLTAADATPSSASAVLPLLLNLDALHSVLLRVSLAAHGTAPRSEALALEQAATLLDSACRDLGDAVLTAATSTEAQLQQLRVATAPPPVQVTPAAPKTVQPAKKQKRIAATH